MRKMKIAIILFILTVILSNFTLNAKTYTVDPMSHDYDNSTSIEEVETNTQETDNKDEITEDEIVNVETEPSKENDEELKDTNKEENNKETTTEIKIEENEKIENTQKVEPEPIPPVVKEKINLQNYKENFSYTGFSEDDIKLINAVLDAYETAKNTNEERYEVILDYIPTYQNYRNATSFFHIYYGIQKETFDVVFDLVIHGNEYASIKLYTNNMKSFDARRQNNTQEIKRIISSFNEGSEKEKTTQIAKYIAKQTTYTDGYFDVDDIMLEGKGVCNAYTLTFTRFCQLLGIKCDVCIGYTSGGKHAWNKVTYSDGSVEYFDVTFYDTGSGNKEQYLHMKKSPHIIDSINLYYYD